MLPILIIPGFMSSGLEIVESSAKPNWIGRRLWLNLSSLGFSAFYFGSATKKTNAIDEMSNAKDHNDEESTQLRYKSAWLEHMRLDARDHKTESKGVKVRAISGLEGVDYLTPGMFTNMVSYVFGPVIDALSKAGYTPNQNLEAAPYDWRLPPSELERRDRYFTRTMQQVEQLYSRNSSTPVVILCHSLGTKTAHYFLNFCASKKGQKWIDQHIHTYMPVGAPHLGAPKALRSLITGDKMSLDAFLSDSEALILGRSFGSGAWLLPKDLPQGVSSNVYITPHGLLHVSLRGDMDTAHLTERRLPHSIPHRFQVVTLFGDFKQTQQIKTPFHHTLNTIVRLEGDQLSFSTSPKAPAQAKLQFILLEPGIKAAKYERKEKCFHPLLCLLNWLCCCCVWTCLCRIFGKIVSGVAQSLILSADSISILRSKRATPLAFSEVMDIPPAVWTGKTVKMEVLLIHENNYSRLQQLWCSFRQQRRSATMTVELQWLPHREAAQSEEKKSLSISQPIPDYPLLQISGKDGEAYSATSGLDILVREGLDSTLELMNDHYDADPLDPRSTKPPPVRRIHAIHGTQLPTETGAVYRRGDTYSSPRAPLQNLYQLDIQATVKASGYRLEKGILLETPPPTSHHLEKVRCSGDGTVPWWSLRHVETWRSDNCEVSVKELPKAEHREILADPRFHQCLVDYCVVPTETA